MHKSPKFSVLCFVVGNVSSVSEHSLLAGRPQADSVPPPQRNGNRCMSGTETTPVVPELCLQTTPLQELQILTLGAPRHQSTGYR